MDKGYLVINGQEDKEEPLSVFLQLDLSKTNNHHIYHIAPCHSVSLSPECSSAWK